MEVRGAPLIGGTAAFGMVLAILENNNIDDEYNNNLNKIKIVNGQLIQGCLDKNAFTKTSKGLIHTIFNDLGNSRACDFINDLQKIVSYILQIEGYSVGISDLIANRTTNEQIVVADADYGIKVPAVIEDGIYFGTQFHPEKSGKVGSLMIRNFLKVCKQ